MIEKELRHFLADILRDADTTNERYYEFEKTIKGALPALEAGRAALCEAVLKKANQLMWLNLTLERAAVGAEKKADIRQKKEDLLEWFRSVYTEVDERQKNSHNR